MAQFTFTAGKIVPIVSGVVFERCYGVLVGTAGTVDITDISGVIRSAVPLQAGYNPISCTLITFGTASNIFALYEVP